MCSMSRVYTLSGEWFINCFQWFFIIRLISLCIFKRTCFCILPKGGKLLTACVPSESLLLPWVRDCRSRAKRAEPRVDCAHGPVRCCGCSRDPRPETRDPGAERPVLPGRPAPRLGCTGSSAASAGSALLV